MKLFYMFQRTTVLILTVLAMSIATAGLAGVPVNEDHGHMRSDRTTAVECQQRCVPILSSVFLQSKHDQDEQRRRNGYSYPHPSSQVSRSAVKNLMYDNEVAFRHLRPPDRLSLYGVYRI